MGGLAFERIDGPLSDRRAGLGVAQEVRQIGENGKWAAELMCHQRQKLVLLPIGFFQLKGTLAQFAFQTALRRHVANRAGDQDACLGRQRAERDIDWKLVTVLAQAVKLEAAAHRPRLRVGDKRPALSDVCGPETLRHEYFEGTPNQLLPTVAE